MFCCFLGQTNRALWGFDSEGAELLLCCHKRQGINQLSVSLLYVLDRQWDWAFCHLKIWSCICLMHSALYMVVLLKLKRWLVWSYLNKLDSYSGATETEQIVAYHKLFQFGLGIYLCWGKIQNKQSFSSPSLSFFCRMKQKPPTQSTSRGFRSTFHHWPLFLYLCI